MSVLTIFEKEGWNVTLNAIRTAYGKGGVDEATRIFGTSFLDIEDV